MSQDSDTFIAIAQQLLTHLPHLIENADPQLSQQLSALLEQAEQNPQDDTISNQIRFLFLDYPLVDRWLNERLSEQQGDTEKARIPVPSYSATRGLKQLPGNGIPVSAGDKYVCPICSDSVWTRMYKGELPEDCDRHRPPVKRILASEKKD